jgi:outer membrane protein assembly factor BamB
VYTGSNDLKLYAIDAKTGAKKWESWTTNNIRSSPAITDSVAYIGSLDGKLYAIDLQTGNKKWSFQTGGGIYSSPAVLNSAAKTYYPGVSGIQQ